jgi:hypothetical protein
MTPAPAEITQTINTLAKQCYAWESAAGLLKTLPNEAIMQREIIVCDTALDHHMPPTIGAMYGFGLGVLICFVYSVGAKMVRRAARDFDLRSWMAH